MFTRIISSAILGSEIGNRVIRNFLKERMGMWNEREEESVHLLLSLLHLALILLANHISVHVSNFQKSFVYLVEDYKLKDQQISICF